MKEINVYYKDNKGNRIFLVVLDDCESIAEAVIKTQIFFRDNPDHFERVEVFIQEFFNLNKIFALYEEEEVENERKMEWRFNIKKS